MQKNCTYVVKEQISNEAGTVSTVLGYLGSWLDAKIFMKDCIEKLSFCESQKRWKGQNHCEIKYVDGGVITLTITKEL